MTSERNDHHLYLSATMKILPKPGEQALPTIEAWPHNFTDSDFRTRSKRLEYPVAEFSYREPRRRDAYFLYGCRISRGPAYIVGDHIRLRGEPSTQIGRALCFDPDVESTFLIRAPSFGYVPETAELILSPNPSGSYRLRVCLYSGWMNVPDLILYDWQYRPTADERHICIDDYIPTLPTPPIVHPPVTEVKVEAGPDYRSTDHVVLKDFEGGSGFSVKLGPTPGSFPIRLKELPGAPAAPLVRRLSFSLS